MSFMHPPPWLKPVQGVPHLLQLLPGKVSLVGAGPGDPELLTVKAARVLHEARLVLYDHLVGDQVLALLPSDAERIYVGKESSCHSLSQEGIIDLMCQLARSGRSLVRLKGGDCYVFGRGGEEAVALAQAGIPFEVVPGITAAQGAGAYAGIPLTHRDHAGTLVLATGHLRDDAQVGLDWSLLARPRQTVVFYMGVATLSTICTQLIVHGMAAETPAAIVERATMPEQRCLVGTLASLPDLAANHAVKAPALIIVGEVVSLQGVLSQAMSATHKACASHAACSNASAVMSTHADAMAPIAPMEHCANFALPRANVETQRNLVSKA